MASPIPSITLASNGAAMPAIGLGVAVFSVSEIVVEEAVLRAIEVGYRHFDTARVYHTEKVLGRAVARALEIGLIGSRAELFITSKLWTADAHPHLVVPGLKTTLSNMGLEYLDLFLIHWPLSSKPGNHEFPLDQEELMPMDFKAVWEAMEDCQKLGLTKAIGVSNFSSKKLQIILDTANILPAVNQVEMNPYWQQKQLREFCKEKGILITAYSPLGGMGTSWGSKQVMDSEILHEIAKNKGKTVAQVCLRWAYEQGVSMVVKSFNGERMKENLQVFDWELSKEDLLKIEQIPQKRGCPFPIFVYEKGPYKSLNELWDDEVTDFS